MGQRDPLLREVRRNVAEDVVPVLGIALDEHDRVIEPVAFEAQQTDAENIDEAMVFEIGRRHLIDALRTMSGKTLWMLVHDVNKPAHIGSATTQERYAIATGRLGWMERATTPPRIPARGPDERPRHQRAARGGETAPRRGFTAGRAVYG